MAVKLGDAYVVIGTKDELDKGFSAARRRVDGFLSNITQGIAQGVGQAIANAAGRAIAAGIERIDDAINKASDLNETLARTNAVYKENAAEVIAWSTTTSRALGVSQEAALSATGTLGNMFKQLGFTGEQAVGFSKNLVEASADIVAFHNVSEGVPSVLNDISSAFRGEFDPIQKYIPLINAANVAQQALIETGKESADQLTQGEKAAAAYTIIMRGMGDAVGAAAREIESAASQQRIFDARMEESAARLGQVFLPVRQAIFRGLNELITLVEPYGLNIMDSLAQGLADGIVSILPVLQQVRALFVYWLKPGSPPRLLRELTDWGQSAMQEYLRGWTLADFDALKTVGGMIENVVRSFAGSGDIKETDLVSRVFGTTRTISEAVREFRALGFVSESTLGRIADAAGPAGTEIAGLVREYFELQEATEGVARAQSELNGITDRYQNALNPINKELDAVRAKQQELRENQRLEELGDIIRDPRADVDDRQLARLEAQEIQLERQARALENERDTALDAATQKLNAAKAEEDAQRERYAVAQNALEQQIKTNALIEEEADLRLRLANEALATEEKRRRDLEAAQRAEAAELERIADAQLRYQLATTDTAGQLEILQGELAKVEKGSADYYNILTQIATLQERLTKENKGAGGDLFPSIDELVGTPAEIEQASAGIQALSTALDEAFKVLAGTSEQGPQELSPQWQNFADGVIGAITDIGDTVGQIRPIIDGFIGLFTGEADDTPALEGDGFFSSIVPGLRGLISTLTLLRDGEWSALWDGFKSYISDVLTQIGPDDDPRTFGFYSWLQDSLIPAIDALAAGDWKTAWDNLAAAPVQAFQNMITKIQELFDLEQRLQDFMERFGFPTNPFDNPGPFNPSTPGQDPLPSSPFASFPGVTPNVPAVAGVGSSSVTGDTVTYFIEQHIGTNGDFGGARQGAEDGIRATLLQRRLQGA